MGQGRGVIAERHINECILNGGWVILKDCHLSPRWLPSLGNQVEHIQNSELVHDNFRLWLTSHSSGNLPASILEKCMKVTWEPITNVKTQLVRFYSKLTEEELHDCQQPKVFKKLLFALSIFHATIIDRKKYGANGWNLNYEWSEADFEAAKGILKIILNEHKEIPFRKISYLIGEIIYGGRIRDERDYRLIKILSQSYFSP
jgi:dynein heavy chain, axonemal